MTRLRSITLFLSSCLASWPETQAYTSDPIGSRKKMTNADTRKNVDVKNIKSDLQNRSWISDTLVEEKRPHDVLEQLKSKSFSTTQEYPPLSPPFPNGPCGGKVITLPATEMYAEKRSGLFGLMPLPSMKNLMLTPRDISVWLPKEYSMQQFGMQRFPILYCHDGQNAFEDSDSWTGSSWRMIGALTRLYERGMLNTEVPPIVVLIPSADGDILPGLRRRHAEYGDMTLPFSQAHGEFIAEKLHPYIMNRFRVKDGPENVSTIGSSLGGQASLQLVLRYPEIFGGVACLSPCFQAGTIASVMANLVTGGFNTENGNTGDNLRDLSATLLSNENLQTNKARLRNNHKSLHSKTIYIDNGGDHDDSKVPMFDVMDHFTLNDKWWNPGYFWLDTQLQPTIDAVRWALDRGGVDFRYLKFPGARHNERGWAQRIHEPIMYLYGQKSTR